MRVGVWRAAALGIALALAAGAPGTALAFAPAAPGTALPLAPAAPGTALPFAPAALSAADVRGAGGAPDRVHRGSPGWLAPCPEREGDPGAAVDTVPDLHQLADIFASSWEVRDIERLSDLLASDRIQVQFGAQRHSGLTRRQAVASLRDMLRGREDGRCELLSVSEVGGTPARGFAELRWTSTPAGTTESVRETVFVGFLQVQGEWRVSEIRVLR